MTDTESNASEHGSSRNKSVDLSSKILSYLAHTGLAVAAIAIGFTATCDNEGRSYIIDANTYLKIAGFIGILDAICNVKYAFNEGRNMDEYAIAIYCCGGLFDMIWSIIGAVVYTQLSYDCEHSAVGLMIFAFLIVKFINFGCRFVLLAANGGLYLFCPWHSGHHPDLDDRPSASSHASTETGGYGSTETV